MRLTAALAGQFARAALGHVTREYPGKLDHVLTGPEDLATPRVLHPIFFGSFDWHSCVHAYWLLARLLRICPELADADRIRELFATSFTRDNVAVEVAYLLRPFTRTFERPYGWAWLLKLAAELQAHPHDAGARWSTALQPLTDAFAERLRDFLPKARYPIRSGVHSSTAFALTLAMDYAQTSNDVGLAGALTGAAHGWYLADADCQAWEPNGEDFLSPCLIEAECMRRMLPPEQFAGWFSRFLPRLTQREPRTLFQPVVASDRSDGKIAHLDGLNLSRAWCWSRLAGALPGADPRVAIMRDVATVHLAASIHHLAEDYMGEHWLASFALLALEAADEA
jgi:hypothetical protein